VHCCYALLLYNGLSLLCFIFILEFCSYVLSADPNEAQQVEMDAIRGECAREPAEEEIVDLTATPEKVRKQPQKKGTDEFKEKERRRVAAYRRRKKEGSAQTTKRAKQKKKKSSAKSNEQPKSDSEATQSDEGKPPKKKGGRRRVSFSEEIVVHVVEPTEEEAINKTESQNVQSNTVTQTSTVQPTEPLPLTIVQSTEEPTTVQQLSEEQHEVEEREAVAASSATGEIARALKNIWICDCEFNRIEEIREYKKRYKYLPHSPGFDEDYKETKFRSWMILRSKSPGTKGYCSIAVQLGVEEIRSKTSDDEKFGCDRTHHIYPIKKVLLLERGFMVDQGHQSPQRLNGDMLVKSQEHIYETLDRVVVSKSYRELEVFNHMSDILKRYCVIESNTAMKQAIYQCAREAVDPR
jgi:hypothetical protein